VDGLSDSNRTQSRNAPGNVPRRPSAPAIFAKVQTMQPHGVMFHYFHDCRHPAGQGSLSAEQLAGVIHRLGPDRILGAREWLTRALAGALEADQLCLTFDDNLRCQYDVALPVLRDFGRTAFWFIPTATTRGEFVRLDLYRQFRVKYFDEINDFYEAFFRALAVSDHADLAERTLRDFQPGAYLAEFPFYSEADRRFRYVRDEVLGPQRYHSIMDGLIGSMGVKLDDLADNLWMKPDQLRRLHAEGHVLGLHTHTHPTRIAHLAPEQQLREYRDNYTCLMALLGEPPITVAHPCNSYSRHTLAVLRRLGIKLGFRADLVYSEHSKLEFARRDAAVIVREGAAGPSHPRPAWVPLPE
jgi:peptidoglycan/xylan/chitin deacetylase (PgdA/CDA1 family)